MARQTSIIASAIIPASPGRVWEIACDSSRYPNGWKNALRIGAPVAHEDDPERAVRAALAIRDWVREEEQVPGPAGGEHGGEALAMLGPGWGRVRGWAAGDVVNTAAPLRTARLRRRVRRSCSRRRRPCCPRCGR